MGRNVVKRKIPITPMMKQLMPYIDFEKAKRVNLSTLQTTMKRLFPNHHSHELRHTFISRKEQRKRRFKRSRQYLGWTFVKRDDNYYRLHALLGRVSIA